MSREQWGHGYWSGYLDCQNGVKRFPDKKCLITDFDVVVQFAHNLAHGKSFVSLNMLSIWCDAVWMDCKSKEEAYTRIKKVCKEREKAGMYDISVAEDADGTEMFVFDESACKEAGMHFFNAGIAMPI